MSVEPMQEVAEGVIVRPMLTIDDAIDLYLGDLNRLGREDRTRDTYRRCLDDFCSTLPRHWDVAKVRPDEIRRFLDKYNRKSPAYRAQKDSVLRGFFNWLYHEERIKRSPMDRMLPPRRQRPEDVDVTAVSADDVRKLLSVTHGWTERLTIGVLAYLGPRRRATSQLRLSDYDQNSQRIRFREKGGKTVWKPCPAPLVVLLQEAIASGVYETVGDPYLIPSYQPQRRTTGDRDDRVIWRTVRKVADRAGVKAHTHSLRAAFAVYYLEEHPGDIEALRELLGHRSLLTTQTYLRRLDRDTAMETVRTLDWDNRITSGYRNEETLDADSYVYFIACGDIRRSTCAVKIGIAADPLERLADLQTAHHETLKLLTSIPGDAELERDLHGQFRKEHLRGEWFSLSPRLRKFIANLDNNGGEVRSVSTNFSLPVEREAEKEGFEPSINANRFPERAGTQPRDFDLQSDLRPKARERRET